MNTLVIGGTRFIGPHVVRALVNAGHQVAVFNRGQSKVKLPRAVTRIVGDRRELSKFVDQFKRFSPEVVIDLIAYTEEDAMSLLRSIKCIARRVVVVSSADVYRAYDRWRKALSGPLEAVPLTEDAPLRNALYPYRHRAKGTEDRLYNYDKILVERVIMNDHCPRHQMEWTDCCPRRRPSARTPESSGRFRPRLDLRFRAHPTRIGI